MALIEVTQIRYVSATIRLDETTAAQVDHMPRSSTHQQTMWWTKPSPMFSRKTAIFRTS